MSLRINVLFASFHYYQVVHPRKFVLIATFSRSFACDPTRRRHERLQQQQLKLISCSSCYSPLNSWSPVSHI